MAEFHQALSAKIISTVALFSFFDCSLSSAISSRLLFHRCLLRVIVFANVGKRFVPAQDFTHALLSSGPNGLLVFRIHFCAIYFEKRGFVGVFVSCCCSRNSVRFQSSKEALKRFRRVLPLKAFFGTRSSSNMFHYFHSIKINQVLHVSM